MKSLKSFSPWILNGGEKKLFQIQSWRKKLEWDPAPTLPLLILAPWFSYNPRPLYFLNISFKKFESGGWNPNLFPQIFKSICNLSYWMGKGRWSSVTFAIVCPRDICILSRSRWRESKVKINLNNYTYPMNYTEEKNLTCWLELTVDEEETLE